ncbi:MAG: peroxiredoxin [Colwellia sp.]|nr:peroxiredoxin [Colwellia sp.]
MSLINIGDKIPEANFKRCGENRIETLSTNELFNKNKVLVIGVMGAFTPACTNKHLPDFVPYAQELKNNSIAELVICISVADPFVLKAWGNMIDPDNNIMMLTDTNAEFTKTIGLDIDLSHLGLGTRSTRYAMFVENGIIKMLNVEKQPQDVEVTSKKAIEEWLQQ